MEGTPLKWAEIALLGCFSILSPISPVGLAPGGLNRSDLPKSTAHLP
ncbi:hypothetical protein ACQ4M5_04495 [Leptolyngbya sp. AN10]